MGMSDRTVEYVTVPAPTVVPHEPVTRRRSRTGKGWDVWFRDRWMTEAEARAAGAYDDPMPTHTPSAVTRRQGPKGVDSEPHVPQRTAFGRNYPKPKEETMPAPPAESIAAPEVKTCTECGTEFRPRQGMGRPQVTCTPEHMANRRRRLARERDIAARGPLPTATPAATSAPPPPTCVECGTTFETSRPNQVTCSAKCRKRRDNRVYRRARADRDSESRTEAGREAADAMDRVLGQQKPDSLAASTLEPKLNHGAESSQPANEGSTTEPAVSLSPDPPEATPVVPAEPVVTFTERAVAFGENYYSTLPPGVRITKATLHVPGQPDIDVAPPARSDDPTPETQTPSLAGTMALIRLGGIEIALEEAIADLSHRAEAAEQAIAARDEVRIVVDYLRGKLASLQA